MPSTALVEIDETFTGTPLGNAPSSISSGHAGLPFEDDQWPVIIIGSSMIGKSLGLLLGYHGIRSVSFDRHASSSTHPRAAGLNFRTSEILRQLDLENYTLEQSGREFDLNAGMLLVEKLVGGKVIAHLQEHDPEKVKGFTPSNWVWIAQSMFEPINLQFQGDIFVVGELLHWMIEVQIPSNLHPIL